MTLEMVGVKDGGRELKRGEIKQEYEAEEAEEL